MRTTPQDNDSTRRKAIHGLSQEAKDRVVEHLHTLTDAEADAYFQGILFGRDIERPRSHFDKISFPTKSRESEYTATP